MLSSSGIFVVNFELIEMKTPDMNINTNHEEFLVKNFLKKFEKLWKKYVRKLY